MALKIFLNDIFRAKFECKPWNNSIKTNLKVFDDFLEVFLGNILRIFQIKEPFLNNQRGGGGLFSIYLPKMTSNCKVYYFLFILNITISPCGCYVSFLNLNNIRTKNIFPQWPYKMLKKLLMATRRMNHVKNKLKASRTTYILGQSTQ
jgi:hypothetical protein